MNLRSCRRGIAALLAVPLFGAFAQAAGDPARGAQVARACLACHSLSPGRNLTGPSLWNVVGRKAGTAERFGRYSAALKASGLQWDERHLDAWLKDPAALVPGNSMGFAGIPDAKARADLIAYLEAVSAGRMAPPDVGLPDLKQAPTPSRVTAIGHCGDAYRISTGDGKTRTFWEFNLRFKTDGSADGPALGHPVIVGNGMRGDRAAVVFSRLEEIATFVKKQCP
ncbi:MAG: cytochrome c family protein [Pseudomonadota bacterium]|nr:cytochrome c family protein [Pseudomonadota bacterium]